MICPHCYSNLTKKNGSRKNITGEVKQAFHCRNCGKNFSETIRHEEIVTQNVRLAKQKQALQDLNRIERKSFRENARVENAVEAYSKELVEIFKKKNLSKLTKTHRNNNKAVGVIQFSDVHFNELVSLESNKYDFTIASQRCRYFVSQAKKYFKCNNIKNVMIALTGDLLNSDRRLDELLSMATNRAKATFLSVDILQQVVLDLNKDFNVNVACVTGNEGRAKPELGWVDLMATDNYDYTIFQLLKYLFKGSKVTFVEGDPLELVVNLAGQNLLMIHGHGSISSAGLEKSINQIIGRYALKGCTIDYVIFGHVHSAWVGDNYSRSSSMVGANDYSDKALNLSGRASQNCYIFYNNGNRDGIKVDLQNIKNFEGYKIDESLAAYNAKSHSKTKQKKVVFEVVV